MVMRGADLRSVQEMMGQGAHHDAALRASLDGAPLAAVRLLDAPSGGRTGSKPAPDLTATIDTEKPRATEVIEVPTESQDEPSGSRTRDPLLKSPFEGEE